MTQNTLQVEEESAVGKEAKTENLETFPSYNQKFAAVQRQIS
jgi:hypothetical protein